MRAPRSSVDVFFEARSVAVVGASDRAGSLGAALLGNVIGAGFAGPVWPVNPGHGSLMGRKCFASIAAVEEKIDLAIVATPAASSPALA